MRNFALVSNAPSKSKLPVRGTKYSAGYDFYTPVDIFIPAKGISENIPLYVKAYMNEGDFLLLKIRSGLAVKHGIILCTSGVIDSDYVDNEDNEGNICVKFANLSDEDFTIKSGERCCQGVFLTYGVVNDDTYLNSVRIGGHGSTNVNEKIVNAYNTLMRNSIYLLRKEPSTFNVNADFTNFECIFKKAWEIVVEDFSELEKYQLMEEVIKYLNQDFSSSFYFKEVPPFVAKPSLFLISVKDVYGKTDRYKLAFGYKNSAVLFLNSFACELSKIPVIYFLNKNGILKEWENYILNLKLGK